MLQGHVVGAVFRREVGASFASPTAYVFITIFVFLGALAAFWSPAFFEANLANLDLLHRWFPYLLLLLVPAIAMGVWAEERREGTEELVATLPARDAEVAIGKYLGCVAVYTVALALSFAGNVGVLAYLGSPDPGLLASSALGQWLAGVSLLGFAMLASAATRNLTVAFILGAALCGLIVGAGLLPRLVPGTIAADLLQRVAFTEWFAEFGRGVVSPGGVLYFILLGALGLWANIRLVDGRRRAGAPGARAGGVLALVRTALLVVAGSALLVIAARSSARIDTTAERLWSLAPQTRQLLAEIPADRPILATAYISEDVPPAYAQTRETLLGLLRECAATAGAGRFSLRIVPTEPYSDEAREAQQSFGITARTIQPLPGDPDPRSRDVFLGVAMTSGASRAVIPFMSRGLSVEYELARAVRTLSDAARKRVGVLDTGMGWFGQFNYQTFTPDRDWPIVDELRKQYEVVQVPRAEEVPDDLDVLIAPQPSLLTDAELAPLLAWIGGGRPTLVLEDPLPLLNPALGTSEPRGADRSPFQQAPPDEEPKADLAPLWELLGVTAPAREVVWDAHNPRPALSDAPREFVFIGPTSGAAAAFNESDAITSGLQEVVLMCAGLVRAAEHAAPGSFEPILRAGPISGIVPHRDVLQRSVLGYGGFNPARRFVPTPPADGSGPALAARVRAPLADGARTDVVLLRDVDMVSEMFFALREEGYEQYEFDNVTLVLNAVDSLAGDESLVELRKRRPTHRTLERLDERRRAQEEATLRAVEDASRLADEELAAATGRMQERVDEIGARQDLDETTRSIMIESVRRSEQRRLDVQAAAIESAKQAEIAEARAEARREIDRIELGIRAAAVALPPIPAFVLGCAVFLRRRARESEGVARERLAG